MVNNFSNELKLKDFKLIGMYKHNYFKTYVEELLKKKLKKLNDCIFLKGDENQITFIEDYINNISAIRNIYNLKDLRNYVNWIQKLL